MKMFESIVIIFTIPVVIVLPILYGVYFVAIKKKEGWMKNPFAWPDLMTPYAVAFLWLLLASEVATHKSLSNLCEPFYIGLFWCAAWIVRLWRYSRITENKMRVAWEMLGITITVTITLALFMPCLPE